MKNRLLSILLFLSIAWALTITFFYWDLKNNPRIVAITTESGRNVLQANHLDEIERMTFLRQFLDRYFTYDSSSFWPSQTSLAFLMAPPLSEDRVREVSRLRDRIQQKDFSQQGQLQSLKQTADGYLEAQSILQITETAQRYTLFVSLRLKLQETERTLENPWGLLVKELTILNSTPKPQSISSLLHIQTQSPTLLTFPCSIENVENPDEKNIKIKITTLNISELQIVALKAPAGKITMTAACKDKEYHFDVINDSVERTMYVAFSEQTGSPKPKASSPSKTPQKDMYEKTIETVLGIKLDK